MDLASKKRVTMKLRDPNPLFVQWLTEWRDKAIETDSKMQYCFGKALQSLKKYPLPLQTGRDCKILNGFGEKLCQMIDKRLQQGNHMMPIADANTSKNANSNKRHSSKKNTTEENLNKSTGRKEYIPAHRSGAYAILLALYNKSLQPGYKGYLLKTEIITNGLHLCDKSFVKPDPGSFYTAWSSMKTLLDKNLVIKRKAPAQFSLSDEGVLLAHKLHISNAADDQETPAVNRLIGSASSSKSDSNSQGSSKSQKSSSQEASLDETFIFFPHSFDIILLVDKAEISGGSNTVDDFTLTKLTNLNVKHETKHLKVGDYTWICRHHSTGKELVLPYIIERKRMDDLGGSIKDGRFHEQKFRLKQCGIQNVIYLIESYGNNTHTGLPITTLYQAATNTLVQDNFSVKFTDDLQGTIEYLSSFTSILKSIYEDKTLVSCPKENLVDINVEDDLISLMAFETFNKNASKTRRFKVKELFVRQLLQLKGMSVDRALAVVEKYPTPQLLHTAYKQNSPPGNEKLLSTITYGKLSKKIGPVISKTIHQFYTNEKFL